MNSQTRFNIFILVLIMIVALIIYRHFKNVAKEKRIIAEIKIKYDRAIKQGDKSLALELGRLYYSRLRGGYLTLYDEQAIANDLTVMK